jgi:hypothetical protein
VKKSEENGQLARCGHRWDNTVKIYFAGTGWENMGWISFARGRNKWYAVVNTVMDLGVP